MGGDKMSERLSDGILMGMLSKHIKWLNGAGGERAGLSDANLSGADLRGANLKDVNISGADLRGANLKDVNLSGADLSGADLSGADLRRANLSGANLRKAGLSDANLSGADLRGACLAGTIYESDFPVTIETKYYTIVKTDDYIQIGCQKRSKENWKMLYEDKLFYSQLQKSDPNAEKFMSEYKTLIEYLLS